jgi:hypothetical protein
MLDHRRATLIVTFVVLAVVIGAPAAFGQATATDTQISYTAPPNTCIADTIVVSGTLHTETSFSSNPNGTIHIVSNTTLNATGVGSSTGTKYVINDTAHNEVNSNTKALDTFIGAKMRMIAQGSYPNLTAATTYHLVVDANGNIAVSMSKFTESCN